MFRQNFVQIVVRLKWSVLQEAPTAGLTDFGNIVHPDFPYQTNCKLINRRLIVENRNHILPFWFLYEQENLTVTLLLLYRRIKLNLAFRFHQSIIMKSYFIRVQNALKIYIIYQTIYQIGSISNQYIKVQIQVLE